jgi:hypothetical protein
MRHIVTPNPSSDTLITARHSLRLQRAAIHLHRMGPRALCELLTELVADEAAAPVVLDRLDAWMTLEPATVHAVLSRYCGGRSFPPVLVKVPA